MTYVPESGYFPPARNVPYWSDAYMFGQAERQGLDVLFPGPNELFIDIDTDAAFELFQGRIDLVTNLQSFEIDHWTVRPSKSGLPKRHIVVILTEPVTDERRILLQALLGSDLKRELLSFTGLLKGQEHPVVFFERPETTEVF